MGCVLSGLKWPRTPSKDHVTPEPLLPTLGLTPQQQQLLIETWELLKQDIAKVGVIVFIRLFETHPECKDVFFLFHDVDDLKLSKELRAHGLRVLSVVEKSVARIENVTRLEKFLFELGRSHYRYKAPPRYYQYVGIEFLSAIRPILKEKWTPEVEEVWKVLFTYICAVMKAGYQEEENKHNEKTPTMKRLEKSQATAM
ncbi:globin X [Pelobates cultripes]|uniref:Globin X n=1 Tax=Pelobates cultripes TaxID=61616 RepID=A0AAD1TMH4_PELCU|nr:globin X [Pelobates cultripes]